MTEKEIIRAMDVERYKLRMRYEDIHLKTGISTSTIGYFFGEKHSTSMTNILDIADSLGLELVLRRKETKNG